MKYIFISIAAIIGLVAISYGFGWIGVHQTKTIGKAMQNAKTDVYYETQAFVTGKKQEALKFYKEYNKAATEEKEAIKQMVSHSFADFDESKLDGKLQIFISNCKYN